MIEIGAFAHRKCLFWSLNLAFSPYGEHYLLLEKATKVL